MRAYRETSAAARLLTLREAACLSDAPEDKIRKDVERGVLHPSRSARWQAFHWGHVVAMSTLYRDDQASADLRRRVYARIEEKPRFSLSEARRAAAPIDLGPFLRFDYPAAFDSLRPRLEIYEAGLSRIVEDENILGGAAVFQGTRLSVRHIGGMIEAGETEADLLADFPALTHDDLSFAQIYFRAHSPLGRPRKNAGTEDAAASEIAAR